jgi:hypothetical protein
MMDAYVQEPVTDQEEEASEVMDTRVPEHFPSARQQEAKTSQEEAAGEAENTPVPEHFPSARQQDAKTGQEEAAGEAENTPVPEHFPSVSTSADEETGRDVEMVSQKQVLQDETATGENKKQTASINSESVLSGTLLSGSHHESELFHKSVTPETPRTEDEMQRFDSPVGWGRAIQTRLASFLPSRAGVVAVGVGVTAIFVFFAISGYFK